MLPEISFVLPVYNRLEYLPSVLDGIKANLNTYPGKSWLFILDDGSDEDVEDIEYHCTTMVGKNVKFIRRKENKERAVSRNELMDWVLEATSSEYIFLHENDDYSYHDRAKRQIAYMLGHEECGVLGGVMDYMNEEDKELDKNYWHPPMGYHSGFVNREYMLNGNTVICTPTICMRRKVAEEFRFRSKYIPAEDWDWLLRVSRKWEIHNLTGWPLVRYRVHPDQSDAKMQQINKKKALEEEWEYESHRRKCNNR